MKAMTAFLLMLMILTGCLYDSPLTEEHRIPIDTAVLGVWEVAADRLDSAETRDRIMILKFSETEYLVHYIAPADAGYYRGYPVEIGGIRCVQLQIIGTPDGLPGMETKPFIPVSYKMIDGLLEVKLLNNDLIDGGSLKGTAALRAAFLAHKDDPHLFRDPVRFRRR